jgi:hypothetical protein
MLGGNLGFDGRLTASLPCRVAVAAGCDRLQVQSATLNPVLVWLLDKRTSVMLSSYGEP